VLGKNKKKSPSIYIGFEMHDGCIYKRHNNRKKDIEMKKKKENICGTYPSHGF